MPRTSSPASMLLATVLMLLAPAGARAHEGHDHGPEPQAPASETLAPRMTAESEAFELVAVLEDGHLLVYLDDFATNRPIEDAALEVESGSFRASPAHSGGGVYQMDPGPLAAEGRHELIVTIRTPAAEDLLLGTLEVPADAPAAAGAPAAGGEAWYRAVPLLQGAVVLLALALLGALLWRDRRDGAARADPSTSSRTAAVAPLLAAAALLALAVPPPAAAHEGHDHGEPPPAPAAGLGAARLPGGVLFVPKSMQRLLGIRTARAEAGEWPDTFTMTGHVIPDPNASALVQAPLPGRVELAEGGLPLLGAWVREGQVLAHLVPILDAVDRTTLLAELAEIEGRITNLARNLERLRQLGANAPRQELEQTDTEHASLVARRRAIADSFSERLPLKAEVAGVLALRNASPGQVVASGETLFTLVDPGRLLVEALLYDTDHASHFTAASAYTADGRTVRLTPLGTGYELRGHALPIQFRIDGVESSPAPDRSPAGAPDSRSTPQLVVRQPLTVVAQMYHGSRGIRVPSAAVQRAADGGEQVWVHVRPEHFRAQRVQARALGGGERVVISGLAAGDRVVTSGAALLGQVR